MALPADLDYATISGLSKEIQHKLGVRARRPRSGLPNPRRHAGGRVPADDPPEEAQRRSAAGAERLMSLVSESHAEELSYAGPAARHSLDDRQQRLLLAYPRC